MDALPCRYLVSQNPEVEAKILAELDGLELSITPQRPHPRRMTYADMNRLTYLQATIKVLIFSSFPLHSHMISRSNCGTGELGCAALARMSHDAATGHIM